MESAGFLLECQELTEAVRHHPVLLPEYLPVLLHQLFLLPLLSRIRLQTD